MNETEFDWTITGPLCYSWESIATRHEASEVLLAPVEKFTYVTDILPPYYATYPRMQYISSKEAPVNFIKNHGLFTFTLGMIGAECALLQYEGRISQEELYITKYWVFEIIKRRPDLLLSSLTEPELQDLHFKSATQIGDVSKIELSGLKKLFPANIID